MPPPIVRTDFRLDTVIATFDLQLLAGSAEQYSVEHLVIAGRQSGVVTTAYQPVTFWRYCPAPSQNVVDRIEVEAWVRLGQTEDASGVQVGSRGYFLRGAWPQDMTGTVVDDEGATILDSVQLIGFSAADPSPEFLATLTAPADIIEQRPVIETDADTGYQIARWTEPAGGRQARSPRSLAYVRITLPTEAAAIGLLLANIQLHTDVPNYVPQFVNRRDLWAQIVDQTSVVADDTGAPGFRPVQTQETLEIVTRELIEPNKIVRVAGLNYQVATSQVLGRTSFYETLLQRTGVRSWYL